MILWLCLLLLVARACAQCAADEPLTVTLDLPVPDSLFEVELRTLAGQICCALLTAIPYAADTRTTAVGSVRTVSDGSLHGIVQLVVRYASDGAHHPLVTHHQPSESAVALELDLAPGDAPALVEARVTPAPHSAATRTRSWLWWSLATAVVERWYRCLRAGARSFASFHSFTRQPRSVGACAPLAIETVELLVPYSVHRVCGAGGASAGDW